MSKNISKVGNEIHITDDTPVVINIEDLKLEKNRLKAIIDSYQERISEINELLATK